MGYTGRVYLLRRRTFSMCSALFALLHIRFWYLLKNAEQLSSGLRNKQKRITAPNSVNFFVHNDRLCHAAYFHQHCVHDDKTNTATT